MPSIRQKLVTELKTIFTTITVANGYNITVKTVEDWRVLPFTADELPALVIRDLNDDKEKASDFGEKQSNELLFSIELVVADGANSMDSLRKLFSDVSKA